LKTHFFTDTKKVYIILYVCFYAINYHHQQQQEQGISQACPENCNKSSKLSPSLYQQNLKESPVSALCSATKM
jgi:hypothetical protein